MPRAAQPQTPTQRVAIDARKWNDYGIGTSIRGLTSGLIDLLAQDAPHVAGLEFVLLNADGRWPIDAPQRPSTRFTAASAPTRPYSLAELLRHHRSVSDCDAVLYHSTHYPLPLRLPTATVVTVHDLIQLEPGAIAGNRLRQIAARTYARWMLGRAVDQADALLTVSQHTRGQLERRFAARAVEVVGNGVEQTFFSPAGARDAETPREPYVLLVGNPKPHKNVDRALQAFAQAQADVDRDAAQPLHLVLVGAGGEDRQRLEQRCEELGISDRCRHLGRVSGDRLPALYAHAEIFLFPSLHEGFGLPALEAMAAGTAVIGANAGAIPEVVEDAAVLVDPRSVDAFARALFQLHTDPGQRADLVDRGRRRAQGFTWRAVAERTAAVYRRVLDRARAADPRADGGVPA